jgi:phosphomannomutase
VFNKLLRGFHVIIIEMNQGIFKAYDIRGKVGDELSPDSCHRIGLCFAKWLPVNKGIVAVGHDMRPDSRQLAESFMSGVADQGYDVWDLGLITSDMAYFAVGKWDLTGAAVITASHNPGSDNGIKLYRDKVTPVGLDSGLADIRDMVLDKKLVIGSVDQTGVITKKDISEEWVDHCLTFVSDLKPFTIAIDAGNGMAGHILPKILPRLPFRTTNMYFDLDGTFPNHEANPQKPENLKDLSEVVVKEKLDFGVAFDGDGDRAGFVDDLGRPVLGTDLITIAAKFFLDKYPGSEIIHEVRTSRSTQEFIKSWGGTPYRCKAGRVNIGKVLRERGAVFGGETTGHLFFRSNYDADSGLIAALVVMQAISDSGEKLSSLIDKYRTYYMGPEINFSVSDAHMAIDRVRLAFSDGQQDELDGLTVNYPDRWFNIRASNTEPLVRLNAEAPTQSILEEMITKITKVVEDK